MGTGPPGPVRVLFRCWPASRPTVAKRARPYAENDVPQPQLDLALGLTKVKPPVSPSVT